MIITKKNFNLTPKYKGKWPFTVPVVTVQIWVNGKENCFSLVHNFGGFALSGALEDHGFDPLAKSGIWADDNEAIRVRDAEQPELDESHPIKKSLSPFFEYARGLAERELKKNG